MNEENPAAAGAVFDSDYTLVPSDDIRITNNIEKVKQITSKLSSLDGDIKNKDSKLFSSLRNKITILQTRVRDINNNLMEFKQKMFKAL